jgi:hypothetical protein
MYTLQWVYLDEFNKDNSKTRTVVALCHNSDVASETELFNIQKPLHSKHMIHIITRRNETKDV